jgi:hypothetical protein
MININDFSVDYWSHNNQWFVCFPDGSGIGLPDKYSLRIVLLYVLSWIARGCKSIYEV